MNTMIRRGVVIAVAAMAAAGCAGRLDTAIEKLLEARALSADLLVQFTRSADAGNRAVMAVTDEASSAFAREAEGAMQAVQQDVDALGPILGELRYSADERGLLEEFGRRFAEYRTLNQSILGLAVENTNLKAQRLSFGSGQEACGCVQRGARAGEPVGDRERSVACRGARRDGHRCCARDSGRAGAAYRRSRR